ncbi:unnamed protein product [Spodoptera exigua]|nr:unnamed protein product [Spodoptera exigua]
MVKIPEWDDRDANHRTEEESWEEICRHSNQHNTPMTLIELEEFAEISSHLIPPTPNCTNQQRIQKAMNKLRELYNLEFRMICHKCGTGHYQDEVTAPER